MLEYQNYVCGRDMAYVRGLCFAEISLARPSQSAMSNGDICVMNTSNERHWKELGRWEGWSTDEREQKGMTHKSTHPERIMSKETRTQHWLSVFCWVKYWKQQE